MAKNAKKTSKRKPRIISDRQMDRLLRGREGRGLSRKARIRAAGGGTFREAKPGGGKARSRVANPDYFDDTGSSK